MATSRDVQEVVSKLSSDKAKTREEGIKLLNTWLEGERSGGFCKLLRQNTLRLKPDEIPHSETWPFLVTLLVKCATLEISGSKKRPPKLSVAKTLRTVVQRAEDAKLSGKGLLLSVVKPLFNHIWDVIKDVKIFQSEYSIMLRQLLTVKEYCYHMRKRIYNNILLVYMDKVGLALAVKHKILPNTKEEIFRNILTFHILLENPPGDFPDNLRENIVNKFVEIFSHLREEGKISRKLMECINTYLFKDGPNLGSKALDIHFCLQEFVFHYWITTHDKGLKNSLILYASLQLKLIRSSEIAPLIEKLLHVLDKEFDQSNDANVGIPRSDTARDDNSGTFGISQKGLMELIATVYYQVCSGKIKNLNGEKRLRRENPADDLKDGIMKGKWLCCASFYFLIYHYGLRMDISLLVSWLEDISRSFERILNDSGSLQFYDGIIWLLRALEELSSVLHVANFDISKSDYSPVLHKIGMSWITIWNSLVHGLPIFSNISPLADAALSLLGTLISKECVHVPFVPKDLWDLRIFKHLPSSFALYFMTCYFSRRGLQSDLGDVLHLRRNLLRAVLGLTNFKDRFLLNETSILLLPAAMSSLCSGCCPFSYEDLYLVTEKTDHWNKVKRNDAIRGLEISDYCVEVLAILKSKPSMKVFETVAQHSVRLPQNIKQLLLNEAEEHLLQTVDVFLGIETKNLADLILMCSFLCNCSYASKSAWLRREKSSFTSQMLGYILKTLRRVIYLIEEKRDDPQQHGCFISCDVYDTSSSFLASLRSLMQCPLLRSFQNRNSTIDELFSAIIHSLESVLLALSSSFKCFISHQTNTDMLVTEFSSPALEAPTCSPIDDSAVKMVDMDLDMGNESNDADSLDFAGKNILDSSSSIQLKLTMISSISIFSTIFPTTTWNVIIDFLRKESEAKVKEKILSNLCKVYSLQAGSLEELVIHLKNMTNGSPVVDACLLMMVNDLLENLASADCNDGDMKRTKKMILEQDLQLLGDMISKFAVCALPIWHSRVHLINCIRCFILLDPCIGQTMVPRLLSALHDTDYRVRLFIARQIGILFQTWDGHDELFQDVCSNFSMQFVMATREKLVRAQEILTCDRPALGVETAVIALAHVALHSDLLESEAIFMICAVAAMDPSQRELIFALLDNLSVCLHYCSRTQYLDEIMGSILCRWVVCQVSLISLVEIQNLFHVKIDANVFMTLCCSGILPFLLIQQDITSLNLVSRIVGQTLSVLVRNHFVQIIASCIALHCSKDSNREMGEVVLHGSLLQFAEISEHERDILIKRHMVSIVSRLLSLSSSSSVSVMPFFTRETVADSIRTVVDGFLENSQPSSVSVVDKLNILRHDRVFKFLVEIHYQITSAVHPRHRCHRLSALEVLLSIMGHRAFVPSTSHYIVNLVGQFIGNHALQDICCSILSNLLSAIKNSCTTETAIVLGEQLQFLVSKLVSCCLPSRDMEETILGPSSKVLFLLHELTVDADPSLLDFVKELEPFPDAGFFARIQKFQEELKHQYSCSSREHFLKFVKRTPHLSSTLVLSSLRTLHKKLLNEEILDLKNDQVDISWGFNSWARDPRTVSSVWQLVRMCDSNQPDDLHQIIADFISKVGVSDAYNIVFHLPRETIQDIYIPFYRDCGITETALTAHAGISDEHLIALIGLLKNYLSDDSVKTIDCSSLALQGILSTERGQIAIEHLDSYERSLIVIHSKSVNREFVEKTLKDFHEKQNEKSLEDTSVWVTNSKSYKMWICPLVHLLISFSNDTILRLCQEIVLLKEEIAEFLLPISLLNLSRRTNLNTDICEMISKRVKEHIFTESNSLIKSIQMFLDALNKLHSHHVTQKANFSSISLKHGRPSNLTRNRNMPETSMSNTSWEKVYWLSIDYLLVARSAIRCGAFFSAFMYVEEWCKEHFNSLTLGAPDFSNVDLDAPHIEVLVAAVTQINEPDGIYGIIRSHKLTSQIVRYEHEEKWSKAFEYYDLLVRTSAAASPVGLLESSCLDYNKRALSFISSPLMDTHELGRWEPHKGLMRSLQQIGCTHVLDVYCQGLTGCRGPIQDDPEFIELQYEAAWRARNWDFSLISSEKNSSHCDHYPRNIHFNEYLHSCLRAFQEGDYGEFLLNLKVAKKELVLSVSSASHESTRYIHSTIVKIQLLDHLNVAWDLRWKSNLPEGERLQSGYNFRYPEPSIPSMLQMGRLNAEWKNILAEMQLNLSLLEQFIAFRSVLLQILNCKECRIEHLLQSASALRKGARFSLAIASLHEFKLLCGEMNKQEASQLSSLGRLEEARVLWAQGHQELAINLAKYTLKTYHLEEEASNVYRLVGKWLAENRSSNSRIVLEKYLKRSVELNDSSKNLDTKSMSRKCQAFFNLAHYTDALFKSSEERLSSSEWQAAMRLRKHKMKELDALIKRLKSSTKGERTDYSGKIQELQKQLAMDKEEAEKLQDDRDNFLNLALEGYQHCLVIGGKYDIRVVFRLVSLWFNYSSRQNVINNMQNTVKEVQSYKFIPLVYQIASRMGSSKDGHGSVNFQAALVSLVKKMTLDHPYHTIYQLLALANGDRVKDKQRSRTSFIVDFDKKQAAERLLYEISVCHGAILRQMKQMVEIYIKLAELETKKEETNKKIPLPREIRSLRQLELVPVVTANVPVDPSCQYHEGSFPHFNGLVDCITVMNGINAPKVIECMGSDGHKYRQLAKSGNDDLRQDAVMEQFFGLVNTFLQSNRSTWKRKIRIRTYKVVPFTPSAGVLEWVDGTLPLGEYLIGSTRNGGAHGRYGNGDWSFLQCREHMISEKDKCKAFHIACKNFRPVMHYFFLERFLQPSDWFEKRVLYTRSVAASSMVGYIVGLGDRHAMNILVDQATAEVVHIDLGVAFEQGLMLKTPERVPFRLTRDIIDGMGVTGVEGVYRRCCEETLSVMRTNKEALLTIIEVFIHDPLYKWALSPLKALQRQKETDDGSQSNLDDSEDECEGNKDAARALLRVKQKLDGYEEGETRSVPGQVVPFTPSAGVLEWVDGTLPLGEYLIGRPVMHYFFLERFLQPSDWFEKRVLYTRSVAASSMVGYIVGLGDRHAMNILIDQATAEVIHIDLGVAFEQGLMLKTPERVPFRLTRDIIDGMGVTGVEGVYRRCCEETLSVMRTNKEALLTIIEVFIHDPLYKWALSPLKALQRQKETDDGSQSNLDDSEDECEGNKDAARALLRVKQKLDGYEEGETRSVPGQVQQLIQDATDTERLCQMFPGWGAWL